MIRVIEKVIKNRQIFKEVYGHDDVYGLEKNSISRLTLHVPPTWVAGMRGYTRLGIRADDSFGKRVSRTEERVNQMDNRLSGAESLVSHVDAKADKADAKAEKAVSGLSNLRLEKRFVLNFKEGANFAFNSPALTDQAKREVDSFFSDLKGDFEGTNSAIFLVAGHTDNVGAEEYNYELGRKRAESVARYLITEKKIDPLRVVTVSYGKSTSLADNGTREGRSKNRRAEILVYKEAIASASSAETGPRAEGTASEGFEGRISAR